MTNIQLMFAIGIPTFTVLVGILLSRSDVAVVRSEIVALRGEMVSLRDSVHRDMVMLHERIAVVETKQR